jgi:multicomponent Na+:H+ antiporter subunit E
MAGSIVRRAVALTVVWLAMTEGRVSSLVLSAASVAVALVVSLELAPPRQARVKWLPLLRFVPWYASRSLVGGIGVMRRAFGSSALLSPGYVRMPLSVPSGTERSVLMCLVNLLPGTISVGEEEDVLVVHAIDTRASVDGDLRELESRVTGLFTSGGRQ